MRISLLKLKKKPGVKLRLFLFNNVLHPTDSSVFKADLNAARVEA